MGSAPRVTEADMRSALSMGMTTAIALFVALLSMQDGAPGLFLAV